MAEYELDTLNVLDRPRAVHFEWTIPILFRPRRTLSEITKQENAVWLAPLLLLTVFALLLVLAGGPVRLASAQNSATMPPDYEYYPPEWQQQYQEGFAARQGVVFIYVFPALATLSKVWIGWFLVGSLLHLALTLAGSRSSNTASLNLVAWASLPFVFRYVVQSIYTLSTHQMISSPGLSGFAAADVQGAALFLRSMLSMVDLYLVWYFVLLLIGVVMVAKISRTKAWIVTIVMSLLLLALQALPAFALSQFGGMQTQGFFFF